jgi:hypothetical protein
MFPNAFTTIYELLHGKQQPIFREQIYATIGIILVISTLVICGLYYYLLNGLRARFNKRAHWSAALMLNVLLNIASVVWVSTAQTDTGDIGTAILILCFINAFYAAIAFLVASLLFKWGSPHASCTPV